jgi:hypothetical protein
MPAKARYRQYRNAKLKIWHLTAEKLFVFLLKTLQNKEWPA